MTCGVIDRHNSCPQDDLKLERKIGSKNSSVRANMTILGMCIVESFLVCKGVFEGAGKVNQRAFSNVLVEQLIDNTFDHIGVRGRQAGARSSFMYNDGAPESGFHLYLSPAKDMKRQRHSPHAHEAGAL